MSSMRSRVPDQVGSLPGFSTGVDRASHNGGMESTAVTARHRRAADPSDGPLRLGSDGLTDAERQQLLLRFRSGIGAKPAADAHWEHQVEIMVDKLSGSARTFPG